MKKYIYISLSLVIFIFVISIININNIWNEVRYDILTKKMSEINSEQLLNIKQNINNENNIIYIGRKSCPDCVDEIKKVYSLKNIFSEKSYTFYYFDVDKHKNESEFLEAIDLYNIDYVPVVVINEESKEYILNYSDLKTKDINVVLQNRGI